MSWIETVAYEDANTKLKALYDRVKGPDNNVDNIMMMHSLRPHSMEGHMAIYKYVLHHRDNTIDKWFLETLGVWVSALNDCDYCVEHHFAGLKRLLNDDKKSDQIWTATEKITSKLLLQITDKKLRWSIPVSLHVIPAICAKQVTDLEISPFHLISKPLL